MIDSSKPLTISSTVLFNVTADNIVTPFGTSDDWNLTTSLVESNSAFWDYQGTDLKTLSANWEDTFTTVQANSADWEESDEILPTVTNYLSTNNVDIQGITFPLNGGNIFNNTDVFGDVFIHGALSALSGIQVFETIASTTSSLSVENFGTGPALYVFQGSSVESVAQIKGADGTDILTINNVDPDQGQDGVKINFTGSGNTLVVGNLANATALVVTSAGNINTTGQILSGDIPLHDIFLTTETDSQTLTYTESAYEISILNGNTINLSSINTVVVANSANWETAYTTVESNSANWDYQGTDLKELSSNWEDTYTTVQTNSADWNFSYDVATYVQANSGDWEESDEIIPTVTNYLSTSEVLLSSLTVTGDISATGTIYTANALTTTISAISADGITVFNMQFTNGLLTEITF